MGVFVVLVMGAVVVVVLVVMMIMTLMILNIRSAHLKINLIRLLQMCSTSCAIAAQLLTITDRSTFISL